MWTLLPQVEENVGVADGADDEWGRQHYSQVDQEVVAVCSRQIHIYTTRECEGRVDVGVPT